MPAQRPAVIVAYGVALSQYWTSVMRAEVGLATMLKEIVSPEISYVTVPKTVLLLPWGSISEHVWSAGSQAPAKFGFGPSTSSAATGRVEERRPAISRPAKSRIGTTLPL